MSRINPNFICCKLNIIKDAKPIKQKRMVFSLKNNVAIEEEVDKLQKENFIENVKHLSRLPNVVIVKNKNDKWSMCVDFIDLKKEFPKDHFTLPRIDQLVDATTSHELLSFMDAYSGYN